MKGNISIVENIKKIVHEIITNYSILVFFVISNFINALLLRLLTSRTFFFRATLIDLGFVLLLGMISLFLKKRTRNTYYAIVSFLLVAICIINSIYYNYYSSYVSVSLISTSIFVKDVGDAVIDFAVKISDGIYLWQFIGLYMVIKKKGEDSSFSIKKSMIAFLIPVLIICIGCIMQPSSSFSRFKKLWNRVLVVNNFGVYVYQADDIFQSLRPTFNNIFGYDAALKMTKEYYESNKKEKSNNEYTNIFSGKNVIVIHAESLQSFVMDMSFEGKEVTPNLNKLKNKGMYFNNFYAQISVGTSSDTEFTYATSLLPVNNGTVFVNYFNNKYITIQNLLNNKGYYVFSMHGNVGDFWNRDTMHMDMGYDKFYSKSSFEIDEEYGLGLSDESFFRQVVPKIKEIKENIDGPYYGTLITLTNHTPWREASSYSDYAVTKTVNIDGEMVTRDYLENKVMGRYIKSVNYMDNAIGNFIEAMDKEGLLDNTVIVIYGDHDARISKNQYDYMYNYDPISDTLLTVNDPGYVEFNDYDYELIRKVPFIIWTKDMKQSKVIDTPMGMIDVLPTLGNMLGVYSDYALGRDIMETSKDDGIVVFKDASYITSSIYYSTKNNEAYALAGSIISDDYIQSNSEYANKINEISDNIITYNLIKDLEQTNE